MTIKRQILFAYALLLVLACGVAFSLVGHNQDISESTATLIDEQLPQLNVISQLLISNNERERLLYEYYATQDRSALWPSIQLQHEQVGLLLQALTKQFPQSVEIRLALTQHREVELLSKRLDESLVAVSVDWNRSRDILASISRAGRIVTPALNTLANGITTNTVFVSRATAKSIKSMTGWVLAFSIAILAIAAFVAYYVNVYISDAFARRRLAMFPERNPRPVLSCTLSGDITYNNPAAKELLYRQDKTSKNFGMLLPADYRQRIQKMVTKKTSFLQWTEKWRELTLSYNFSVFVDLDVCHIYIEDITDEEKTREALLYQAFHDGLTKLPNHRQLDADLSQAKLPYALFALAIDRFRYVTAGFDHKTGDELLLEFSSKLNHSLKGLCNNCQSPNLYRLEGTQFLILYDPTEQSLLEEGNLSTLAQKIQEYTNNVLSSSGQNFYISVSIGISRFPIDGATGDVILQNANAALTRVKNSGGDGYTFYRQELHSAEQFWTQRESQLRNAVANNELRLFYQPKVDSQTLEITGCEALIRWYNNKKLVPPLEFIPLAEQTGLIVSIGEWIIRTAANQAKEWDEAGYPCKIAINISARQFERKDFITVLQSIIEEVGVDPSLIELELTESLLMQNIDRALDLMRELRSLGYSLSLDDFGTGHSSLSYLQHFPIDKLKIDRTFVKNIVDNVGDQTLTQSICQLAHALGLRIIAEGVETTEQLAWIQYLKGEEIQGYLISPPSPAEYFVDLLKMESSERRDKILPLSQQHLKRINPPHIH